MRSTEAYKELAGVARGYAAAGAALALGSTTYGVTGKGVESIMAGATTFKGTQEIFKSSATTLEDTTAAIFRGLGVKSEAEAIAEAQNIQAQSDLYGSEEKLNEKLDEVWDFLDSLLKEIDPTGANTKEAKSIIKSTIASEIKKNPEATEEELMDAVKKKLGQDESLSDVTDMIFNSKPETLQQFKDATTENADYRRRKEGYDMMQTASDLNLGAGLFAAMVGKRFRGSNIPPSDPQADFERHKRRFEKSLSKYDKHEDDYTDEEQAKAVKYQEKEAMAMQEAQSRILDTDSAEAKAVHDEMIKKLEDTTIELTDAAKQEVANEMKLLRDKLLKEIESSQERCYECRMTRAEKAAGNLTERKIAYVTAESTEKARAILGEIEGSLKDRFDIEFED